MCYKLPHRIEWDCDGCEAAMVPIFKTLCYCSTEDEEGNVVDVVVEEEHPCNFPFIPHQTTSWLNPGDPKPGSGLCDDCETRRELEAEALALQAEEALAIQEAHQDPRIQEFAAAQALMVLGEQTQLEPREATEAELQYYHHLRRHYGYEDAERWLAQRVGNPP